MDRELVFFVLCALSFLALVPFGSLLALTQRAPLGSEPSGARLERAAAGRLWLPLVPAGLGVALLVGWALAEPEDAESLPRAAMWLALLPTAVMIRAGLRAARALLPTEVRTAATVGTLKPRVVIAGEFAAQLSEAERRAVLAHEHAHRRHGDPRRIWLAQIATDLQWPLPGAARRFAAWREALELARDDEARLESATEGTDLARALLQAARSAAPKNLARATIVDDNGSLRRRIGRLLAPPPAAPPASSRYGLWWITALAVGLTVSVMLGIRFGEALLRLALGPSS